MKNQKRWSITICSDSDYEQLIAEIYIDEKFVALISQEDGAEKLKIEFQETAISKDLILNKVDLNVFLTAVQDAKLRLLTHIPQVGDVDN